MFNFLIVRGLGIFLALLLLSGCAGHRRDDSSVPRQRIGFAWSVPYHTNDLSLLWDKLQAEHIYCFPVVLDLGTSSFDVQAKDFNRAETAALKIIRDNALTVEIETDANGSSYQTWKNGKKAGEQSF